MRLIVEINNGRNSHNKLLQKLLVTTLIYDRERWYPNYLTYINFTNNHIKYYLQIKYST